MSTSAPSCWGALTVARGAGVTYLSDAEEQLQAPRRLEGLLARAHSRDVPQAEQKAPAEEHEAVGRVVAVPILVQPEQAAHVALVHRPAAVGL